jgi:hypothetical protein
MKTTEFKRNSLSLEEKNENENQSKGSSESINIPSIQFSNIFVTGNDAILNQHSVVGKTNKNEKTFFTENSNQFKDMGKEVFMRVVNKLRLRGK